MNNMAGTGELGAAATKEDLHALVKHAIHEELHEMQTQLVSCIRRLGDEINNNVIQMQHRCSIEGHGGDIRIDIGADMGQDDLQAPAAPRRKGDVPSSVPAPSSEPAQLPVAEVSPPGIPEDVALPPNQFSPLAEDSNALAVVRDTKADKDSDLHESHLEEPAVGHTPTARIRSTLHSVAAGKQKPPPITRRQKERLGEFEKFVNQGRRQAVKRASKDASLTAEFAGHQTQENASRPNQMVRDFVNILPDELQADASPEKKNIVREELQSVARAAANVEDELDWQGRLNKIVSSQSFDTLAGLVLALNAISMGIQVEFSAKRMGNTQFFEAIGTAFTAVFTVELVARMVAKGRRFFKNEDWKWNIFDTAIIILQMVDESVKHMSSGGGTSNMGQMMKMLRVVRVLRLVRMVRLIPGLKHMVYLILASITSFFWTGVLQVLMMYCFAIFFTTQGSDFVQQRPGSVDLTDPVAQEVNKYWGSIGVSITSLFMAMTGGDDWRNFIDNLGKDSLANSAVFYCYITFATMVMLNLVTGVFVEGAQRIIREDKDKEVIHTAAMCFLQVDEDLSNSLSLAEFEESLETDAMCQYCDALEIQPCEARDLFLLLDEDSSGELSIAEFVEGCLRLRQPARALDFAHVELNLRGVCDLLLEEFNSLKMQLELQRKLIDEIKAH